MGVIRKNMNFDSDELGEDLKRFEEMSKKYSVFKKRYPKGKEKLIKKNGAFTFALGFLISQFVNAHWDKFCEERGKKNPDKKEESTSQDQTTKEKEVEDAKETA